MQGCPDRQRDPLRKAIQWSVTPSEAVHWWVRGHVEASNDDADYERRGQGNAWAGGYAEVAARKSARGHRVALPLSLGAAYGSSRADGPWKMEWRIHRPGYRRLLRHMDSCVEEQLTAYPEDALTLAPLHLGEWHPPLQACGRCQHRDKATSRFRCPWERWRTAARAAGGHWRILDGDIVLVVSNLPGSRTCLGEQGRGTHDWAAIPWGQHVAPHVVAVLEF